MNVWVGTVGDWLNGTCTIGDKIMHDGSPAHFSLVVRDFLNGKYGGHCIGRVYQTMTRRMNAYIQADGSLYSIQIQIIFVEVSFLVFNIRQ